MSTGIIAAFIAVLALGFVEGLGRFYPAKQTWRRFRAARGRLAVRRMRERFEEAAGHKTPKTLALVLLGLVVLWIATSSLLDKRWFEVATDVLPYVIVSVAMLRTPRALRNIAERMKDYERESGEDPDAPLEDETFGDGGPTAIAL